MTVTPLLYVIRSPIAVLKVHTKDKPIMNIMILNRIDLGRGRLSG